MIDLVDVAVITSTKGLRGEVKLKPLIDIEIFELFDSFVLSPPTPSLKKLTVVHMNTSKEPFVAKFKEVNSIDEASVLKSHFLQLTTKNLPEGYYPKNALIGFSVFSSEGKMLGTITAVEETKVHDIFVMKTIDKDSKEVRFGAVKEIVLDIDLNKEKIIINLPKGLMDLAD